MKVMLATHGVKFFLSSLESAITIVVIGEKYEHKAEYGSDTVSRGLRKYS